MQVLLSFLKLGSHWTLPRDCIVGTSLGGTTREILEGFRVGSCQLCWEIVQQFMSEGPMNYFGGLSNIFASEGSPMFLPKLGSVFSRTKSFCFEN